MATCEKCKGTGTFRVFVPGRSELCDYCRLVKELCTADVLEGSCHSMCSCDRGHYEAPTTCPDCQGTGQKPEPTYTTKKY